MAPKVKFQYVVYITFNCSQMYINELSFVPEFWEHFGAKKSTITGGFSGNLVNDIPIYRSY